MPSVICERLSKSYGAQRVIQDLSLEIRDGELFSLLGPSGCGKSTLLRMIAGLEQPDSGRIVVGSEDVTTMPAHLRSVGMVFQQYALFPHLTVSENVRFGLDVRGLTRAVKESKVKEALALVRLDGLGDRHPHQLSGGQQQRVAIARALAIEPRVVLLDEPLSNLDAKLRHEVREEIRELHRSLGLTMIHVTHDQAEALSTSDRIAVIFGGKIAQVGAPEELYERPVSQDVAAFLGDVNVIAGIAEQRDSGVVTLADGMAVHVPGSFARDSRVTLLFRPERVRVLGATDGVPPDVGFVFRGRVLDRTFTGSFVRVTMQPQSAEMPVLVATVSRTSVRTGDDVAFGVPKDGVMTIVDRTT